MFGSMSRRSIIIALLAIIPAGVLLGVVIGKETSPQTMREGPEPIGRAEPPGGWAQGDTDGPSTRAVLEGREVFRDQRDQFRPDLDYDAEDWGGPGWSLEDEGDHDDGAMYDYEPVRPATRPAAPPRTPPAADTSEPPPPDDGLPGIW